MKNITQSFNKSVLVVLIGTLTLFLASSKELYEKLFVDWFDACRIVIDIEYIQANKKEVPKALVQLFAYGEVPEEINVHFESDLPMKSVSMLHSSRSNLLLHQDVSNFCPVAIETDYCDVVSQEIGEYSVLEWKLRSFNKHINPVFQITFTNGSDLKSKNSFQTYIKNPDTGNVCKVEAVSAQNFWAWGHTWQIQITILLLMILLTAAIFYLKDEQNLDKGNG